MLMTEEEFRAEAERYGVPLKRSVPRSALRDHTVHLKLNALKVFPLGVECYVGIQVGERQLDGVAPSSAVTFTPDGPIIKALRFLREGNYIVRLSPTSMGTYKWQLNEREMQEAEYKAQE